MNDVNAHLKYLVKEKRFFIGKASVNKVNSTRISKTVFVKTIYIYRLTKSCCIILCYCCMNFKGDKLHFLISLID